MKESLLDPTKARYDEIIPAGEPWIHEISNGQFLRIVDVEGNQAADTLFYNAYDYQDRYSAQDTIRTQANIYLTTGTNAIASASDKFNLSFIIFSSPQSIPSDVEIRRTRKLPFLNGA